MRLEKERGRGMIVSYKGTRARQLSIEESSDFNLKVKGDWKVEQEVKKVAVW